MSESRVQLQRSLGFWTLTVYGIGDILGAGIYALVGEIAGVAGQTTWVAFAVALCVAAVTALSYAELSSRFPRSGGESYFCQQAFRSPSLAALIGWLVFCSGIVSLATVSRAFAGYFLDLIPNVPDDADGIVLVVLLMVLSGISFWGIRQSSAANVVCTAIEFSGLMIVIVCGAAYLMRDAGPAAAAVADPPAVTANWLVVAQGAGLAFFAFIGFEDMVNVAEEVERPDRNMPAAILTALCVAGVVYVIVVIIATAVVPPAELSQSRAPLVEVVQRAAPVIPRWSFTLIALFAVANTGLLNMIMGSRLLYGMANQGLLSAQFSRVHPRTQTPHFAIGAIFVVASVLALSGTLSYLAGTTSVLLLVVFLFVNLALVRLKRRGDLQDGGFQVPILVPVLGAVSSLGLIAFVPPKSLLTGAGLAVVGLVLVGLVRLRQRLER